MQPKCASDLVLTAAFDLTSQRLTDCAQRKVHQRTGITQVSGESRVQGILLPAVSQDRCQCFLCVSSTLPVR